MGPFLDRRVQANAALVCFLGRCLAPAQKVAAPYLGQAIRDGRRHPTTAPHCPFRGARRLKSVWADNQSQQCEVRSWHYNDFKRVKL